MCVFNGGDESELTKEKIASNRKKISNVKFSLHNLKTVDI